MQMSANMSLAVDAAAAAYETNCIEKRLRILHIRVDK